MLEYYRKWITGPLVDVDAYRELAHSIGAYSNERPGMSRNNILDHTLGAAFISEWNGRENVYISIAFYDAEFKLKGYAYLYYDFDSEENPELAIAKGLEFANSIKKRYGAVPVTYLSGFKGLGVLVPLKQYVDWETYKALWQVLIQPYRYGELLDRKVLDARRLHRVPWTYNIKKGEKRLSKLITLDGKEIAPRDFDWENYEPLDPGSVEVYRIEVNVLKPKTILVTTCRKPKQVLPHEIEKLKDRDEVPQCIRNIIHTMMTSGDADHYARLVLVWYLKWIGFTPEEVLEFFSKYARDFNEKIARYQIEYAFGLRGSRKDYKMPRCKWMKEHGLCLGCGWDRNPVTYTYSKAEIDQELVQRFREKTLINLADEVETIINFAKETGKHEFSYEDFKKWLEAKTQVDASTWHRWERILRLLAEKGVLGRKYLVNGEWVDYGSGKVEKPPSKAVVFYLSKKLNEN